MVNGAQGQMQNPAPAGAGGQMGANNNMGQPAEEGKSFWTKWWVWLIAVIVILVIVGLIVWLV